MKIKQVLKQMQNDLLEVEENIPSTQGEVYWGLYGKRLALRDYSNLLAQAIKDDDL